mgnify:CR=1 FL=1
MSVAAAKQISFADNGEIRVGAIYVLKGENGKFRQVASVVNGTVSDS